MTVCVLLIVIRPDGDVKPDDPLVLFEKNRIMPEPGSPLISITHTLHYNATLTYTRPRPLSTSQLHIILRVTGRNGAETENGSQLRCIVGPNA